MSFSFGFSGDDIEGGEHEDVDQDPETNRNDVSEKQDVVAQPRVHTLKELLTSLPSQITYNSLRLPALANGFPNSPPLNVLRRSLVDIRAQLMAEASEANDNDHLIENLNAGDLSKHAQLSNEPTHVIELGAGSAIPSLTVLKLRPKAGPKLHLTLADYNADVLKLCTAPNTFLHLCPPKDAPQRGALNLGHEYDYDLEEVQPQLNGIEDVLAEQHLSVDFVSGGWGKQFVDLVTSLEPSNSGSDAQLKRLILATETIYSPDTLPVFTSTLLSLLRQARSGSRALVAAKQIYFGVGGGVAEFERELKTQDANAQLKSVWQCPYKDTVGRVILEVTLPQGP
ncbi:Histidine protein methyltransferase 1 [Cyphellophora attinorum]|uniref:protein-histidine N-methyltransferase n=1 Tax=Cyphellophora attinorum TaxID=1664694 RepID=A0A0N0NRF9_9EURO|nr:Histidine protein methyltransferase 1 [Phialophora attinorum]KPI45041.1 Histidine protein methyltransferase 1 [Phialophora attinorum]